MRISPIFVILLSALIGLYSLWVARKAWRDPNNWHIDIQTKRLGFHAWYELGFAVLMLTASALLLALEFLL